MSNEKARIIIQAVMVYFNLCHLSYLSLMMDTKIVPETSDFYSVLMKMITAKDSVVFSRSTKLKFL